MLTFQELVAKLSDFWSKHGCVIHHPYGLEMGAGTFNPATFFRCLGPEPYHTAYIEPCRRPADGRYGKNPNRLQHFFQYQVLLKPSPENVLELYMESLKAVGIKLKEHDIRLVHNDWESPTLGAWGLGWEVWMDGMEITQFTYFQCMGGVMLQPISAEITYGIERLAMYLQNKDRCYDLQYNDTLTYGDIYYRNEIEWSTYNFETSDPVLWGRWFEDAEREAVRLIELNMPLPAYDFVMKASHAFNMLDARGVISVTARTGYIARIRELSRRIAEAYVKSREEQKFPLLKYAKPTEAPDVPAIPDQLLQGKPDQVEDYVLEIGCEELPDSYISGACHSLRQALTQLLTEAEIPFKRLDIQATPRRLTAYIHELALGTAPQTKERKGPSLAAAFDAHGQPTKAGVGFFQAIQFQPTSLAEIQKGLLPGVEIRNQYLFASVTTPGKASATLLAAALPKLILALDFPNKMTWSSPDLFFARPLRWIVSLFGKYVLPFQVGSLVAGNISQGHTQLCPGPISLSQANHYQAELRRHYVMVDLVEREANIRAQLREIEKAEEAQIAAEEVVLKHVLNLVEWPILTVGNFDPAYLRAPKEVLISEMVHHQRYFPLEKKAGALKDRFVITANNTPSEQIRKGNQRALSPRLADGLFLYEQDLKQGLNYFNEKLKQVVFQKQLGSVYDKVLRIEKHAIEIHRLLPIGKLDEIKRTALLCKADLASGLVYEFPELQGVAGRYYAREQGEPEEVAIGIDEHWAPRGEHSPLPTTPCGIIVGIADKLDNLIGCFACDQKPTSSSDPYALRRQVLGIIKTLIAGKHRLPLKQLLEKCLAHMPVSLDSKTLQELIDFISNRIKTVFLDYNLSKDEIEASLASGFSDIYDSFCRIQALHHFRKEGKAFHALHEVYKRAKGQLEGQKRHNFNVQLLKEAAEIALNKVLEHVEKALPKALQQFDYDKAYALLAELQPALAKLFDEVKVLADDPALQQNRLALLQRVFVLFNQLLDFSKIQAL